VEDQGLSLLEEMLYSGLGLRIKEKLDDLRPQFPIGWPRLLWQLHFDRKPTAVKQVCYFCQKTIEKGEPRVRLERGYRILPQVAMPVPTFFFVHMPCFFAMLTIKLEEWRRRYGEKENT